MAEARMEHPEMNKILVQRLYDEYLNTGDLDHVEELMGFDFRLHGERDLEGGIEGVKALMAPWYSAFPDLRLEVLDMIAQGNKVGVRVRVSGTQRGEFMGRPPSDKRMEFMELGMFRLEGEMIVEYWGVEDTAAMYGQLGMMPP